MVSQRNQLKELERYLSRIGISVNIGKNKARGNQGIFIAGKELRIDVSNAVDENARLSILLHEFAHYVHYCYDHKLKSLKCIFGELTENEEEELLRVTVHKIPKDSAKFLYSKKMYWRFYSLIPRPVRVFKKNISGFRRRLSWFNRRGRDFYIAYQHQKVENKRILINSQHGANLSGNMFYILKEVCTNPAYSDYDIGVTYGNEKNKKQFISMMEEYNFSHNKIIYLKNFTVIQDF